MDLYWYGFEGNHDVYQQLIISVQYIQQLYNTNSKQTPTPTHKMQNDPQFTTQFTQLHKLQQNLFKQLQHRQKQLSYQLQSQQQRQQQQQQRIAQIKARRIQQQVTHPYNEPIFKGLGYCMEEAGVELDRIEERQRRRIEERERERNQMEERRRMWMEGSSGQGDYPEIYRQYPQEVGEAKGKGKGKQVSWKLLRKIRQHDVQENKKILEKQLEQKLNRIGSKFKNQG